MSLTLEQRKLKRTGFFPAFFIGGLLAASFPILNTAVRPDQFIYQPLPALDILMDANWQMKPVCREDHPLDCLFNFCAAFGDGILGLLLLSLVFCRQWFLDGSPENIWV